MDDQVQTIEARCAACMAWTPKPVTGVVQIGTPKQGVCRMFPPTPAPLYNNQGQIMAQANLRPVTTEDDSCLHFLGTPTPPANH